MEKLLTVGAAARLAEVSADTIRSWERDGRLSATRTTTGIRLFRRKDVERIVLRRRDVETCQPLRRPVGFSD